MTNAQSYVKRELEILAKTTPDAIVTPFTNEILALCEKFGQSGQSGGSAPFTAKALSQAVEKLCLQKPICPITGIDEEWNDVTNRNNGKPMFQNNRDSRVFKDGKEGKAYFIEAIVFDGDIGGRFTGNGSVNIEQIVELDAYGKHNLKKTRENIGSTQYIKAFPFTPKTFFVDVIDHRWKGKEEKTPDVNGDWWTHTIKDETQLKEVFEYYDQRTDN